MLNNAASVMVLASKSPFGVSSDVREYIPLLLVVLVGIAAGWLWLHIKGGARQS